MFLVLVSRPQVTAEASALGNLSKMTAFSLSQEMRAYALNKDSASQLYPLLPPPS